MDSWKIVSICAIFVVASVFGIMVISQCSEEPLIPREQAIDVVRDRFGENLYSIEDVEVRFPTDTEVSAIQGFGQEAPDQVWVVKASLEPAGVTYEELEEAKSVSENWGVKLYGQPLEFERDWERDEWFNNLRELDGLIDNMSRFPYFGENGSIVGWGYGENGCYWVLFEYDKAPSENMVKNVFETVNSAAENVGFDREVPVKFGLGAGGYFERGVKVLIDAYTGEILRPIEISI